MKDYFLLALGGLKKRVLRTALTMLGIFIGIAAVVALISLGQGMTDAINGQFASLGGDKIIVQGVQAGFGPPGQDTPGQISDRDLRIVRRTQGIDRAASRIIRSATLEHGDQSEVITTTSIPNEPDDRDLVLESVNLDVEQGRMLQSSDRGKIMLGHDLWDSQTFDEEFEIGSKVLIGGESFEVVGLLAAGGAFGGSAIFMNHDDLEDLFDLGDELSAVVAQVNQGEDPEEVAERITRAIRRDRGQEEGFEDFQVETSQNLIDSINTILGVVSAVFIGIAAISLLVGGIGIMNTMYTAVLERTREIGIMKSLGARNGDVMAIFLLESGMLGLAGGIVGVVLGVGLSQGFAFIARGMMGDVLQASFTPELIIGALLFSTVIGMLSGALPARQAAHMNPVDALRGE